MDYFPEKEDTKRRSRNLSEKKRRDQFNVLITELGNMVSPATHRKMDKTSLLRCTIAFLKEHNEAAVQSRVNEIQEEWKPSFLSNDEFTHLMLEALDGFIIAVDTEGQIHYVSESVASLLGHVPTDLTKTTIYDITLEEDKKLLYGLLQSFNDTDDRKELVLHLKRSTIILPDEVSPAGKTFTGSYELVKLSGHFRRLSHDSPRPGSVTDDDHDNLSIKSGHCKSSNNTNSGPPNMDESGTTFFVATARLQTAQLIRELPIVVTSKHEFTSRYSLEWKFLFLDHRAPPIIGFLPFELLGTSGYDYYHPDDLERVTRCHEALMQTGEGTSCCHRFFTKGQHWIWLQTRYFITYHQWNSKPEFVVATHRVLPISDVIKLLKKERDQQLNNSTDQEEENAEKVNNETNSIVLPRKSDKKQKNFPGTSSCSSKSSVCCSTSTRISHEHSSCKMSGYSDNGRSDSTAADQVSHNQSNSHQQESKHNIKNIEMARHQSRRETLSSCSSDRTVEIILSKSSGRVIRIDPEPQQHLIQQQQQQLLQVMSPQQRQQQQQQEQQHLIPPEIAMPPPASVLPQPSGSSSSHHMVAARKIYLTPAQALLQEQLQMKHADLSRRISLQQEELKKIAEQLSLSKYGRANTTPVPVVSANAISTEANHATYPSSNGICNDQNHSTFQDFEPRPTSSSYQQQNPSSSIYGHNDKQI